MKVGVYDRVSTSDKDQNPETQLVPLREFVQAQGWETFREWVDYAPATDLAHRTAWRRLLDEASKRHLDLLLVWRMDRAFRSVLDAATTLERLRSWGVGIRSYTEPWLDTTSPFGEALYYITVAYAQLERGILRERVKAGMERARKQGHRIGRPSVWDRKGFKRGFGDILERLSAGEVSRREAARELGIGYATLQRLLDARQQPTVENTAGPSVPAVPTFGGGCSLDYHSQMMGSLLYWEKSPNSQPCRFP